MDIPYTIQARPETGVYNGKLGIWLFLASEIMLFGGLFSAYMFLRTGVSDWPRGSELLNVPLASINTVLLIISGITMVLAWASLKLGKLGSSRMYLVLTFLLGSAFLAIKSYEYYEKFSHEIVPSTNNFYGIYFALTGLHFLHIAGGLIVILFHVMFGGFLWRKSPERYTNRIEVTGLYWHFVDMVWLVLFPTLYLL